MDEVRLYEEGILTPGFAHTVLCNEDGTLVVPEGIRAIQGHFTGGRISNPSFCPMELSRSAIAHSIAAKNWNVSSSLHRFA